MDNTELKNTEDKISSPINQEQHNKEHHNKSAEENQTLKEEKENTGMDMGTIYKEEREQDLDDLIHNQGSVENKNEIPGGDES